MASAPRQGLGAATGHLVDHLVALTERYGSHLFVCFEDSRIPATTNALEGFFGRAKHLVRRATGSSSTAQSVAQNLGPDFLIALSEIEKCPRGLDATKIEPQLAGFLDARARLARAERPAARRRSLGRNFERRVEDLRKRWALSTPATPDTYG